jgi:C4-dicarboxylate-specific signal transduction histidine kinase
LVRREVVKNDISLETRRAEGLPLIEGDRVQLQQVILNLIVDAIEAMTGISEGARDLLITTSRVESDGILVDVRDSGPDLGSAAFEQVFEAFYSTKPRGLGWAYVSAAQSLKRMRGGYGRRRTVARCRLHVYTAGVLSVGQVSDGPAKQAHLDLRASRDRY